jgi:ABC-2 type transport system ATP-binding protein
MGASPISYAMIDILNLTKDFGDFRAVNDVSFSVERGQVLGFLGPNGAGKSTSMKMITGYLRPTSGTALIDGVDICQEPLRAQQCMGYLPEGAPAWPDMTPRQFLDFVTRIRGLDKAAARHAAGRAIEMTELHGVLDQPIDTLSKGFRRRVGLAQAIVHDPDILIMDEPTDGLDPNQKHQVRAAISEMARTKAIIISTHILEEVDAICTRAMIIDRGRVIVEGTPSALAARSAYHGAVVLTATSARADDLAAQLETLTQVRIEREDRGAEAIFRILRDDKSDETAAALFARVQACLEQMSAAIIGLALEAGRLDDVFRDLTRGAGAEASQ